MIIHSIVPDTELYNGIEQLQAPEEIVYGGIIMQVERISATQAKIIRLVSPDPMVYLQSCYAPGQLIDLTSAR